MARTARLFLALWPAPAVRRALAAHQARWTWPATAACVAPESLHLTLHFIGAVPLDAVPGVADGLRTRLTPFTLSFGRTALWPNGLAVVSPLEVPPALLALHASLAEALHGLSLKVESRPFRPHITLARKAADATPPDAHASNVHWPVHGYALMRSAGSAYTPVARYG